MVYATFGSLRIAVKRGSDLYHLHGDHLGSTSLIAEGSTTTASRTYYAYGAERSASAVLQTDRTFTGQKSDATGLMYYNARDYDSALGTFISPDTIVSDAGRVIHFNRFLYAGGNPLKYIDPSGRDFICVKGGPAFQNDGVTAFSTMFQQAAIEAGWNEDVHGPIRVIDNVEENRPDDIDEDINSVADKIRKSHAENPSRPLVVVAFSWGHPGAELLSKELKSGDSPLDIDLYIGIEPEDFLRWCIFADCTATNTFDAGMVVGIYAADTGSSKTEYRDTDGNIDEKLKEHGIDTTFNWMNGLNGLHNRSGGEERNHEILASVLADGTLISETGHYDINGVGQNSNRTIINLIRRYLSPIIRPETWWWASDW